MFNDSKTNEPEDIFAEVDGGVPEKKRPTPPSVKSARLDSESERARPARSVPAARSVPPKTEQEQILANLEVPEEDLTDFSGPPPRSRVKIIVIIVVGVIILGAAAWGARVYWQNKALEEQVLYGRPKTEIPTPSVNKLPEAPETVEESPSTPPPSADPSEPSEEPLEPIEEVPVDVDKDTDGDGLTDLEEEEMGTDKNKPDTDEDGLSDRDEVEIYQTNPINPDTDKDEVLDGVEVRRGDDPNGPGRLLELPIIE